MAKAFAVVKDGIILLTTVSPDDRTTMATWLILAGFPVPSGMGDFAIREHFSRFAKQVGVTVERVDVTLSS